FYGDSLRKGSDGNRAGSSGAGGLVKRRGFLKLLALAAYPKVVQHHRLQFPRDYGAHPEYRTEWWYVTGWLDGPMGLQVTFFRARVRPGLDVFYLRSALVAGRGGLQPKGSPSRGSQLLLQPAPPACRRQRQRQAGRRSRLARPRMVERLPRRRGCRLGLDRDQPVRRRLADGVPHAREKGRRALR